jgi:MOSC domain-containing protein YiiM
MEIMNQLLNTRDVTGRVDWIGIADNSRGEIISRSAVTVLEGGGIEGEHHCRPGGGSKRQITLIQAEHLPVVATLLKRAEVSPDLLRRNIVVSGINLAALKHQRFSIGDTILRGSGNCPPCSRMEENLGIGGYAAMLGHGGITAIVEKAGNLAVGDAVRGLGFGGLP